MSASVGVGVSVVLWFAGLGCSRLHLFSLRICRVQYSDSRSSTENRERESTILNSNFRVIEGESEHKEGRF